MTKLGIPFKQDEKLVRGLDYYSHTTFEFKTSLLGAQDTVVAGGRYDGLSKMISNYSLPGVGWAAGIERLALMTINKYNFSLYLLFVILFLYNLKYTFYNLIPILMILK